MVSCRYHAQPLYAERSHLRAPRSGYRHLLPSRRPTAFDSLTQDILPEGGGIGAGPQREELLGRGLGVDLQKPVLSS
jgi:hypothetical protein